MERLSDKLDEVANCKMRPQDKIIELIYTHLSMIKETVVRNGNLRAEFFRQHLDGRESSQALMRMKSKSSVVSMPGKKMKFDIDNIDLVADITHIVSRGWKYLSFMED